MWKWHYPVGTVAVYKAFNIAIRCRSISICPAVRQTEQFAAFKNVAVAAKNGDGTIIFPMIICQIFWVQLIVDIAMLTIATALWTEAFWVPFRVDHILFPFPFVGESCGLEHTVSVIGMFSNQRLHGRVASSIVLTYRYTAVIGIGSRRDFPEMKWRGNQRLLTNKNTNNITNGVIENYVIYMY